MLIPPSEDKGPNHQDASDEYEELFETIFDLPGDIPGPTADKVWITFEKMFQVCSS